MDFLYVHSDLIKEIKDFRLEIIEDYEIYLDLATIRCVWPQCICNPICERIFIKHYLNKRARVFVVEGKNALLSTLTIKKHIRKKYEISYMENCIHTPIDENENNINLNVLKGLNVCELQERLTALHSGAYFNFGKNFDEQVFERCANSLWDIKKSEVGLEIYHLFKKQHKWMLLLFRDEKTNMDYTAEVLFKELKAQENDAVEAYTTAYKVAMNGFFPVFSSNHQDEILPIYKNLSKHLKVKLLTDQSTGVSK